MDRLFLDANVLFSAAYQSTSRLLRLWNLRDVVLCTSRYALEEARINLGDENQRQRLVALAVTLDFAEATKSELPRGVSLPDKDVPILLAAMEARANYLLTGDLRHFGPYFGKKIGSMVVISPSEYFKIRSRPGNR
jgi:uncharacterized protein